MEKGKEGGSLRGQTNGKKYLFHENRGIYVYMDRCMHTLPVECMISSDRP